MLITKHEFSILFFKLINCIVIFVKLHNVSLLLAACRSNSKVIQIPLMVNINTWLVRIDVRWIADTASKTRKRLQAKKVQLFLN